MRINRFFCVAAVMIPLCGAQSQPATTEATDGKVARYLEQMTATGPGFEDSYLEGLGGLFKLRMRNKLEDELLLQQLLEVCAQKWTTQQQAAMSAPILAKQLMSVLGIPESKLIIALAPSLDAPQARTRDMAWEMIEGTGALLMGQASEGG